MQTILSSGTTEKPRVIWTGDIYSPDVDGTKITKINVKSALPNYASLVMNNFYLRSYDSGTWIWITGYDSVAGDVEVTYKMIGSGVGFMHTHLLYLPVPIEAQPPTPWTEY